MSEPSQKLIPRAFIVNLAVADTEYGLIASATWADAGFAPTSITGAFGLSFQCRTGVDIRFAFVSGKVATPTDPYLTLKADGVFNAPEKFSSGVSNIFFAADVASVIEGILWI